MTKLQEEKIVSAGIEGRTIIVTGGNRGMGKAASLLFGTEGANVVVAGRNETDCQAVVDEIKGAGGSAIFVKADVANSADCQALVDAAISQFGRLDGALNNAAVLQFGQDIIELPEEEWDRIMNVNLRGMFLCMKYQMAAMVKAGGGAIVNTASIGALTAMPALSAYVTSKHGVIGLTRSGAMEGATMNIRVNALCPGATKTEMFDNWMDEVPNLRDQMLSTHPIGRFSEPIEQARAALFLLSDAASYITGVALPVDGGFTVR